MDEDIHLSVPADLHRLVFVPRVREVSRFGEWQLASVSQDVPKVSMPCSRTVTVLCIYLFSWETLRHL